MKTTFVITDIEADGPVPGLHSMLSIASIAYSEEEEELGIFCQNLEPLDDATPDPDTVEWWKKHPEAWKAATNSPTPPLKVMSDYADWLESLPGSKLFTAHPAAFDYMWVAWYCWKFLGERKVGWSGLDIASYASATLGWSFAQCENREYPKEWLEGFEHNHNALDDVRGYAKLFFRLRKMNAELHKGVALVSNDS